MQIFAAVPSLSDTLVEGKVSNVFQQPVAGAQITISHRGQQIQQGVTDGQGRFKLELTFEEAGTLDLRAERAGYVPTQEQVEIANFNTTEAAYAIVLMPTELSRCAGRPGNIVVGKFLPPPSAPSADLTGHVYRVLSFGILPRLQTQELRQQLDREGIDLVPEFLLCEDAVPRTKSQGKILAQALGGQGMVWGAVADANGSFDIDASVADSGEVFDPAFTTTSHDVDLGHPSDAVIAPMMRAAVLIGVMANFEQASQCQAAIYVSNVVRALTPPPPSTAAADADWQMLKLAAEAIRGRCQQAIPNAGLVQ